MRRCYSAHNPHFVRHVAEWKAAHPRRQVPKYFLCHVRCAGALERGSEGRCLLSPLPPKLVEEGARPVVESVQDVLTSSLLSSQARVFSVGARSWARCCADVGLEHAAVKHGIHQIGEKKCQERTS